MKENNDMIAVADGVTAPAIGVVIVIYNKRCDPSVSRMAMPDFGLTALVLVDNSTDEKIVEYNREFCRQHIIDFHPMGANAGLPRAYNRGVQVLGNQVDFLMILDDDTVVPENCMEMLHTAIIQYPSADVYLPFVYDVKGLLSPNRRRNCLFFRLRRPPSGFSGNMSAINSGLVLRTKNIAGREMLFDESQFLDCVDHLYLFKQMQNGKNIQLYGARFQQSFFDSTGKSSKESLGNQRENVYVRFAGFVKDYVYFCRTCSLNMLLARLYLLFRACKLNLRYRTIHFFRAL